MDTDTRIEAFRQTVERLTLIPGQLQTLAITLARTDEIPGIMARCSCRSDAARVREEQAAIGHSLSLRIRLSQLESELRQGGPPSGINFGWRLMPPRHMSPPPPVDRTP